MSFGAAGNGITDDSQALLSAWRAACAVPKATLVIPSEFRFLVSPVTLQGPCNSRLVLWIDGTILAALTMKTNLKLNIFQWLNFKWLTGFTIRGSGTVNGQWSQFQNLSLINEFQVRLILNILFAVVRFYKSYNILVRDIRIVDSPQCHLKFDSSRWIRVKNVTISSPQDTPNTDGIHLQNTRDVEIRKSNIGCGDDCVSIQTGCSNIHIKNINCNPGHGIRSLYFKQINITFRSSCFLFNIQGGIGTVKNITFTNIKVSNVKTPIMIDQFYCDQSSCHNKTDAVSISGITYRGITGTYSYQPIRFACSDSVPCTGLNLLNVRLLPVNWWQYKRNAFCWKSYGEAWGAVEPLSARCLERSNNRLIKILTKPHNYTC
ncbi:polygalacturonase [Carex littledalei]|uniref:Polygalacturonase n=1 Tax=Carex littledalei TaxID=544730 RepID=A0A833QAV1_9POAL|nr:polygalacturonase [Carex littledalei]